MKTKTITKEMVEEKLRLYQTELQQLLQLQNIYKGGIQACEQLLKDLNDGYKKS